MQFNQIAGHFLLKQKLIKMANGEQMPHAQLFLGAEGHLGLPIAWALAQYVNCENKTTTDSCDTCSSCNKIKKLIHPDLHFSYPVIKNEQLDYKAGETAISTDWIKQWRQALLQDPFLNYFEWMQIMEAENKQGNITARECNEILKKFSFTAFEAPYKILILWLPELLGNEGNKLLKFIEEPPDNTLIFFVSNNAEQILTTILSRTQLIQVPPLSNAELVNNLIEQHNTPNEQATTVALMAEGNYKKAIQLLENKEIVLDQFFEEWINIILQKQKNNIVAAADSFSKKGREYQKYFLSYGLQVLHMALLEKSQAENTNHRQAQQISQFLNLNQIENTMTAINKSIGYIERNANSKIVFCNLTIQLVNR
jgi:DNA polymerase-3 subunit delta'